KIHRVSDDETWALHLIKHMRLQRRFDVSQQNEIGLTIRLRQDRFEVFEHIQLDEARLARVQVPRIFARPPERLSLYSLHPFGIHLPRLPKLKFRFWKIVAYDADEPNRRKQTCSECAL